MKFQKGPVLLGPPTAMSYIIYKRGKLVRVDETPLEE